jgi:hypothetical protein
MAVKSTPVIVQTPKHGLVNIANADASALKTLVTAGGSGSKVVAAVATSSDTAPRNVTIGVSRSAVYYPLATAAIPITAGQVAGTPGIDLLSFIPGLPIDNDGQRYLFLESGDTLDVKALTTVTSGLLISLHSVHGDF